MRICLSLSEAAQIHDWLLGLLRQPLSRGFGASLGGVVLSEISSSTTAPLTTAFEEQVSGQADSFASAMELVLEKVFLAKHHIKPLQTELPYKDGTTLEKLQLNLCQEHFIAMSDQKHQNASFDCSNVGRRS